MVISVWLRDFHPLWLCVPGNFTFTDLIKDCKPHFPHFRVGIRLVLFRFHSPLLTESLLILSPLLRCFNSGFLYRITLFPEETGSPIQPSADPNISVSPAAYRSITTFIGTCCERSPSWVVASHVCIPHHGVTLRYLNMPIRLPQKTTSSRDDSPQPFPDSSCRGATTFRPTSRRRNRLNLPSFRTTSIIWS